MPGEKVTYQDIDYETPIKGFIEMVLGNGNLIIHLENDKCIEVKITQINNKNLEI